MIQVHLPLKPMSVNKAWQGRRFATPIYKKWRVDGLLLLPNKNAMVGLLELSVTFYMKNVGRCDIDNPLKAVLDLLQKKGYYKNDSQIYELHVYKVKSEEEGIDVEIYSLSK